MHGKLVDGWLVKRGKQVVKFWKHNGYAVPASLVEEDSGIKGVILHTEYDGVLWQTSRNIREKALRHQFEDELQCVLEASKWQKKD